MGIGSGISQNRDRQNPADMVQVARKSVQILVANCVSSAKILQSPLPEKKRNFDTLPETNSSPLKMVVSNRNLLFQGSISRCYVSFQDRTS